MQEKKKMGQSCHNLFNHLSKTKSPAKKPFSFLINWEAGQDKDKGVSAVLRTCNREQFGGAQMQVCMLLPPYNTMLCSLPNASTSRARSPCALAGYIIIIKWHSCELNLATTYVRIFCFSFPAEASVLRLIC